ncbi:hypothetical protein [Actinoallomurus sp. CA-150999]|uniref:hypothetical protein n=1 Tax=Actinoallomurus sp. CA-150999 TaxID=3239887 RepID=UPI003D92C04B
MKGPSEGSRLDLITRRDPEAAALVRRLLDLAVPGLRASHVDGEFVFTRRGEDARPVGRSLRYAAIAALGIRALPLDEQRVILHGDTVNDLIDGLMRRLGRLTGLGDVALVCWAAAEAGHADLPYALDHLRRLDATGAPVLTVDAAWVVSALVAAGVTDGHLERARARLLAGRDVLFPHALDGPGLVPWYRAHVGSFADQVYPIQALARLGDQEALKAAEEAAGMICAAQGDGGQWWWHYDARTGAVVEGYPVYSVHQHAMGPMALLDLAEAGGTAYGDAIRKGLLWMVRRPETGEPLVIDELALTWRKVARGDPRKLVRGVRALSARLHPGTRLPLLDRIFRPVVIDRECRPYEFGWLLYAWLTAHNLEGRWNGELSKGEPSKGGLSNGSGAES